MTKLRIILELDVEPMSDEECREEGLDVDAEDGGDPDEDMDDAAYTIMDCIAAHLQPGFDLNREVLAGSHLFVKITGAMGRHAEVME